MTNELSRRDFLSSTSALAAVGVALLSETTGASDEPAAPVRIGSRRELFVDSLLTDRLSGGAYFRLARPHDEGIAFSFDRSWEGAFCAYVTVIHDGGKYRAYYRGLPTAQAAEHEGEVTCLAESNDGVRWTKPDLGLYEVAGTRDNNVVFTGEPPFSTNFSPFVDSRPGVDGGARYKALAGTAKTGLVAFVSSDGLHWRKLREPPVITEGAFDSQNVSFWSTHENCYVSYFRTFKNGIRRISRTTSRDFESWTPPVLMEYPDKPIEHLYTNQTQPYFRAPHLYVAVAARFMPGRRVLAAQQARAIKVDPGYFGDCSDGVFMTTRGGNRYDRTFMDGFIRPGIGLENWVSRTNYPALGIVSTGAAELSIFANQNYGQPSAHLRRYSLRTDGFVSLSSPYEGGELESLRDKLEHYRNAPYAGSELLTKPLIFDGRELSLNFATSAAGSVRVEIQDATGKPCEGYALSDCHELIGNDIERAALWKSGSDVGALAGRPVRLRYVIKDADVYSFRFV
jgi:hypothetical protein